MSISTFTQLEVWQVAHQATLDVYRLTTSFPADERFGLVTQMRRAAISVGANIAEGFGRRRSPDKARFYNISEGSVEEMKYFLILAKDLNYAKDTAELTRSYESVSRMLRKLSKSTLDS